MKVAPSQEIRTSAAGEVPSLNRRLATNLREIAAVTDGSTGSDGVAGCTQLAAVPRTQGGGGVGGHRLVLDRSEREVSA